jgi:Ketopantoate reductase PanE/ApbA C terminal
MVTRAARALDDGAHELVNDWQTYATVQRSGFGRAQLIARSVPPNLRQAARYYLRRRGMRTFFFRLMHETMAVGRAAGAVFPPDFPTGAIGAGFSANDEGPRWRTDLHAGNRLELDWLAGRPRTQIRFPTPGQEAVYAFVKPYRMGANSSAIPHVERFQ